MSVFELAALPKLRRIGLVRVSNLTDQAIYALGERHSTLERIHLSYCDQITVLAIHFLLQKLPKLTHLSLTAIPAFRRDELQQFCREPPPVRPFLSYLMSMTHYCYLGVQHHPAFDILRILWQRGLRYTELPIRFVQRYYRRQRSTKWDGI